MRRWALLFSLLCAVLTAAAITADTVALRAVLAWFALDAAWLAVAYGVAGPRAFGKRADGSMALWAAIPLAPYVLMNAAVLRLLRARGLSAAFAEVAPGVFLGPRPVPGDRAAFEAAGVRAVLDLTCEFGEPEFARRLPAYELIQVLDATAPTPDQIGRAVRWCREQAQHGGVYVHCAAGKGRSAMVVAALCIDLGHADDADSALELIRRRRPSAAPNGVQLSALRSWHAARGA